MALTWLRVIVHYILYTHLDMFTLHDMLIPMPLPCICDPCFALHMMIDSTTCMCICKLGGDVACSCLVSFVIHSYDDILLCNRACDMPCALPMPTTYSHDMIVMISSSMLHLRSTSLHDLISMLSHVASNSWITCSYHMFGCNNLITSHMPCPIAYHMIDLIASHMLQNCYIICVECHTIFTTPYAHYACIVLHLTHVFRHCLSFGVVNDSYAYHRPFIESLLHVFHDLEFDACSLVNRFSIFTSHFHDAFPCAKFMCLHAMPHSLVTPYAMLDDNTCWVNHLLNAWFCFNANHICFSKCLLYLLLLKDLQDGATLESDHF